MALLNGGWLLTTYIQWDDPPTRSRVLVGGWTNPFEKYARQIGSFPQVGFKKKIFETTS